jgi:ankyrin repeat protein
MTWLFVLEGKRKVYDSDEEERFAEGRSWRMRNKADALIALCQQPLSSLEMPLHVACGAYASGVGSLEIIKYLVEPYPESVNVGSGRDVLPLHVACEAKAPLDVIQYLLEQSPETIKARGGFDDYTPLQTALHRNLLK